MSTLCDVINYITVTECSDLVAFASHISSFCFSSLPSLNVGPSLLFSLYHSHCFVCTCSLSLSSLRPPPREASLVSSLFSFLSSRLSATTTSVLFALIASLLPRSLPFLLVRLRTVHLLQHSSFSFFSLLFFPLHIRYSAPSLLPFCSLSFSRSPL